MGGEIVTAQYFTRRPVKAAIAEPTGVTHAGSIPLAGLFPAYYPVPALPAAPKPQPPPRQKRPQLPRSLWPEIAKRAQHESLRELAAQYGVSHETNRAVVRRAVAAASSGSAPRRRGDAGARRPESRWRPPGACAPRGGDVGQPARIRRSHVMRR